MKREKALDLFTVVHELTTRAPWIDKIQIFGSRRYVENVSYGSDVDLLIHSSGHGSTEMLRNAVLDPYIDAFFVLNGVATSVANRSQVALTGADGSNLDAITIWNRPKGWIAGDTYRILTTLSDQSPAMSDFTAGAKPLLIFCALSSEYNAVRKRFAGGTTEHHWSLGSYYRVYVSTARDERLVVVLQTGVASVKAAVSVTRILSYFHRPELAILVGITAGLKNEGLRLGDVIVPTATVDVESGKKTPKGKQPAGGKLDMDVAAHRSISTWVGLLAWQEQWQTEISGAPTRPALHTDCKLACTASVIAYHTEAKSYKKLDRKIRGIEMEALGVAEACLGSVPLIVVKGVSDYANSRKDDHWHSYCMEMVADLAYRVIADGTI